MSFRPQLTVEDDPKDRHEQVDGNPLVWEHKSIYSCEIKLQKINNNFRNQYIRIQSNQKQNENSSKS